MTATQFTSPVGRFVQGDAFTAQTKDAQGNTRVIKSGPNAGQPAPQYFMAVAFAKNDPAFPPFLAVLKAQAAADFPALFPQGPNGPCTHPRFSFKVVDGDGVDDNGKPNAQKEGHAGHWVVRFTSGFAPKVYPSGKFGPMDQVTDKNLLRRGYYVRIAGTTEGNSNAQKPGIYVNLQLVEICGYGPEIVSGPDASAAFKAAPVLPAGAAPTPAAAPAPAPQAPPPVQQAQTGAPYTGYMQQPAPAAPPAPPAPPPAAPKLPPVMTAKAGGHTYEQYRAQGWTDDQLIAQGLMHDHVPF